MSLEPMGPVIVGADGSLASLAAVDLAADEAAGRVTPLVVVHAHDATTEGTHGPAGMQAGHDVLVVAVAKARSEHPCLSVSGALVLGEPAEVLLSQSGDACLLVVGQRGHYGVRGLPVGSVTSQVISQAEIPVIVHRPLDTSISVAQPRPVLVGIDDIAGSDSVVEFGFAEASLRGAPLRAKHVWSESDALSAALNPDERDFDHAQREADRMLCEALAGWSEKYPDVRIHRTVRHSLDVTIALAAASRSAQLAVVGSTRKPGPVRASVSHALVHRAGCPVAVVRVP
jgi:nucleotide-binding universal stress UspA family protein